MDPTLDPTTISPISTSQMPAEVRKTGAKGEQLYSAALDFESELMQQMTQQLASTAQDDSTDSSDSSDPSGDAVMSTSSDAATSVYTSMLPDQLTQSVMSAGGTGMALDLWRTMWQAQGGGLGTTQGGTQATTPSGGVGSAQQGSGS
jgi:Rod binding domain-containing protein